MISLSTLHGGMSNSQAIVAVHSLQLFSVEIIHINYVNAYLVNLLIE